MDNPAKPCFKGELERAVACFNTGDFFECHEVIEGLWILLKAGNPLKLFLQGWLQIAVGFHHWQRGNATGARNLLSSGLEKLSVQELKNNAWVASYDWVSLTEEVQTQLSDLQELKSSARKGLPACCFPLLKTLTSVEQR
jgi:predicted metal-dependent hydrolase